MIADNGGPLDLIDNGTMSNTSLLSISDATFVVDNTGLTNINGRLNPSGSVSLNSGSFTFKGRAQTASTEAVGALNLNSGQSAVTVTPGGTGVNSADLTVASVSRTANSGATVEFFASGTAGAAGSGNGRIDVTAPASLIAAMASNNNMVPWMAVNGQFASYIPYTTVNGVTSGGIGALGTTGYPAYNSTATSFSSVYQPTWNTYSGGMTITGTVTLNSLSDNATTLNFTNPTDTLNVVSGGLLVNGNVNTIGAAVDTGRITSGGTASSGVADLYLWSGTGNNNTNTLNSRITDNGYGASTRLVVNMRGDGNRAVWMYDGSNSYTGGTVVNTSVNLQAASGVVFPTDQTGLTGVVINDSTVTMSVSAGQIGSGNVVTLNTATLDLFLNNTLAGLCAELPGCRLHAQHQRRAHANRSRRDHHNLRRLRQRHDQRPRGLAQQRHHLRGRGHLQRPGHQSPQSRPDCRRLGRRRGHDHDFRRRRPAVQRPDRCCRRAERGRGRHPDRAAGAGDRLADVTLASGARLNLNGAAATSSIFGSLSGSGEVTNVGTAGSVTAATLTVGFDGSSTTFSGAFTRDNDSLVNCISLTKIGSGTMTMTGTASTASGSLTVSSGGVTFRDYGTNNFVSGTLTVNQGSTLTLDNTGLANVNYRLTPQGTNLAVTLNGGNFVYLGAPSVSSSDSNGTSALTLGSGESTITSTPGTSGTNVLTFGSLSSSAGDTATFAAPAWARPATRSSSRRCRR